VRSRLSLDSLTCAPDAEIRRGATEDHFLGCGRRVHWRGRVLWLWAIQNFESADAEFVRRSDFGSFRHSFEHRLACSHDRNDHSGHALDQRFCERVLGIDSCVAFDLMYRRSSYIRLNLLSKLTSRFPNFTGGVVDEPTWKVVWILIEPPSTANPRNRMTGSVTPQPRRPKTWRRPQLHRNRHRRTHSGRDRPRCLGSSGAIELIPKPRLCTLEIMSSMAIRIAASVILEIRKRKPPQQSATAFVREALENDLRRRKFRSAAEGYEKLVVKTVRNGNG